ncbi:MULTISPECIES: response regulator transcription factor [Bacillaceae]|uniref:Response regulator transcription factor n=1 Tax=Evansella alkalicola TaxID=745819 RepID=A0ABS6JPY6_9BACI|nr:MULTISPECIES: response regulator transcription factor [Bacillaceae]MBU9720166.1 response regulator transcription factor [Bacillus alkalicola]
MTKILYIEDEIEIGSWLEKDLTQRGYQVTWLTNGDKAMDYAPDTDIVILDIMIPGLDGFSLGKRIKKSHPTVPVMMLSARTAVDDKLEGLQFADDYVTKPFHPDELAARINVLLRRFEKSEDTILPIQHLTYHPKNYRLEHTETTEEIPLTSKQLQILDFLSKHRGQIVTKEQIYENVWGETYIDGDKTLMVHIRFLREKIEKDPANPTIIETIRGIGYRLKL